MFPGPGTVIGGAIATTTAQRWPRDALFTQNGDEPPSADEVLAEVKRRFASGK